VRTVVWYRRVVWAERAERQGALLCCVWAVFEKKCARTTKTLISRRPLSERQSINFGLTGYTCRSREQSSGDANYINIRSGAEGTEL
jgi:hypothetical protein